MDIPTMQGKQLVLQGLAWPLDVARVLLNKKAVGVFRHARFC